MDADLEFFFDPVCPWAWITSRWVTEVKQLRTYEVNWRFICLKMINENRTDDRYTPEYRAGHMAGLYGLRVADQVRLERGNDEVAKLYTALGEFIHGEGRRLEITDDPVAVLQLLLKAADLPPELADAALDESHDRVHPQRDRSCLRANRKRCRYADHHVPPRAVRRGELLRPGHRLDPTRRGCREVVGCDRDCRHDERDGRAEALEPLEAGLRLNQS